MASGRCSTGAADQINNGVPSIEFLTLQVPFPPPGPSVAYDVPVKFNQPHRVIGVSSIQAPFQTSSIFFHLTPTFKSDQTGGSGILTDGSEQWIPLRDQHSDGAPHPATEGRFIALTKPVQTFYISTDHPAGGAPTAGIFITLFGCDSIEDALLERIS